MTETLRPSLITEVPPEIMNAGMAEVAIPAYEIKPADIGSEVLAAVNQDTVRELSDLRVFRTYRAFKETCESTGEAEDTNTLDLLKHIPLAKGIAVGDRRMLFSQVITFSGDSRKYCVGYTELDDGRIAPRLFYKSLSEGSWRSAPGVTFISNEAGETVQSHYSKGVMDYGYARETKLNENVEKLLQNMESSHQDTLMMDKKDKLWFESHFTRDRLGLTNTYKQESFQVKLGGFDDFFAYEPGRGFPPIDGKPAREVLAAMKLPEDKLPDFSNPVRVTTKTHSLLGEVTVETYTDKSGNLEWNFAYNKDGHVWVNGINSPDDTHTMNSYATNREVASAGVIDSKPLEYTSQIDGLVEGVDYVRRPEHRGYVELLVLDNLQPIKLFRQVRGIDRKR